MADDEAQSGLLADLGTSEWWICQRCHSANPLGASRCYSCKALRSASMEHPADDGPAVGLAAGAETRPKVSSRSRRRRLAVAAVALLAISLAVVALALATSTPGSPPGSLAIASTAAPVAAGPSQSGSPAPSAVAVVHEIGEPVDVDGLQTHTVLRVDRSSGLTAAPPGEHYIAVEVEVEAPADRGARFDQGFYSVANSAGVDRTATRVGGRDPALTYGVLEPGDSTTGWVTFLVPDPGPFVLEYRVPRGQNGEVSTIYVRLGAVIGSTAPTPAPTTTPRPTATPSLSTSTTNFGFPSSFSSTYYAGYGAQRPASSVTRVEASWVQPAIDCAGSKVGDVAIWVGIDDNGSRYLEQLGTAGDCPEGSAPAIYYAWYEMFPARSIQVAMVVHPGDRFSAFVSKRGSTWTLDIRNRSTGAHFRINKTRAARGLQALWIVEAPSRQDSGTLKIQPLADFGKATLTACSAIIAGVKGDIDDTRWAHYRFNMRTSSGIPKATTGALSSNGTSFSTVWRHR